MGDVQIFCDFDGTITKEDTLNKFLRLYADKRWLDIEREWEQGKIGSKDCISRQMNLLSGITENQIEDFLSDIQIDDYFFDFLELVRIHNVDFFVVSDGFDFFINRIFRKYGIKNVCLFANNLTFSNGEFITKFPYNNSTCKISSGVCKCNIIKKYRNVTKSLIYIGDGVSDFCVAEKADFLFAKQKLLEYCKRNKNTDKFYNLIGFSDFSDIISYLKENILKDK